MPGSTKDESHHNIDGYYLATYKVYNANSRTTPSKLVSGHVDNIVPLRPQNLLGTLLTTIWPLGTLMREIGSFQYGVRWPLTPFAGVRCQLTEDLIHHRRACHSAEMRAFCSVCLSVSFSYYWLKRIIIGGEGAHVLVSRSRVPYCYDNISNGSRIAVVY